VGVREEADKMNGMAAPASFLLLRARGARRIGPIRISGENGLRRIGPIKTSEELNGIDRDKMNFEVFRGGAR
jgi:hypothetical protein